MTGTVTRWSMIAIAVAISLGCGGVLGPDRSDANAAIESQVCGSGPPFSAEYDLGMFGATGTKKCNACTASVSTGSFRKSELFGETLWTASFDVSVDYADCTGLVKRPTVGNPSGVEGHMKGQRNTASGTVMAKSSDTGWIFQPTVLGWQYQQTSE